MQLRLCLEIINKSIIHEMECASFNPELRMHIPNQLTHFDSFCTENKKVDEWKVNNISKQLKDSALTVFVNEFLIVKIIKKL